MPHLVPQARLSRNLAFAPLPHPAAGRARPMAARADLMCDYYFRLPPSSHAAAGNPPQYVKIAKAACQSRSPAAPPLRDVANHQHAETPPFLARSPAWRSPAA